MPKRKIIRIEHEKCNGCGLCIPNCPEGALRIIDGKARLISDLFCDGLGACIGHCPQGAIVIEEREAQKYNERQVIENIVKQGHNVIKAHLEHLKEHGEGGYLKEAADYLKEKGIKNPFTAHGVCPGSKIMDFRGQASRPVIKEEAGVKAASSLSNWPVQLMLVPAHAPYLEDADILISADCVPFAYASFHQGLLQDKVLLAGCPKLDDIGAYREKITQILKNNHVRSVTYAHMEVPCCFGLVQVIKDAIAGSGKDVSFHEAVISIKGERLL